jgi:ABC-2 type transport system permease protein
MWAMVKREWFVFFSTPLGYLSLGFFLTLSTLFLWFLDTDFNLLNAGICRSQRLFLSWLRGCFYLLVPGIMHAQFY